MAKAKTQKRLCKGKTRAGTRCTRRGADWCAQHVAQAPAAAPADTKRTPKKARARKQDWRPRFLVAFEAHVTVSEACAVAEVSRSNVYSERARSPEFAAAWDDVEERSTEGMEAEARRRAVEGWIERGIFDGEGEQVGEVRKFSDTLLIFLLKARRPKVYRENKSIEHTGVDGGPIAAEITTVGAKEVADAAHDFLARLAGPSA
jgi:hypothetical protein